MNEIPVQSLPDGIVFHPKPESNNFKDITGESRNFLTAIGYGGRFNGGTKTKWWFMCQCGTVKLLTPRAVLDGKTKSCGCMSVLLNRKSHSKHGMEKTPEYRSWQAMKTRCYNPRSQDWERYGGRGISVCDRWFHSFENFFLDMGARPEGCSIDRIDNNGNYEPGNCRWACIKTQAQNKSNNLLLTHNGVTKCLAEWADESGISRNTMYSRVVESKWEIGKAISAPTRKRKQQ